jgi:endo-1,3(4)-beta-glucanase
LKLQQLFLVALLFILQACGGGGSSSSDSGNDNNGGDDNNNTSTTVEGRAIDGPLSGSLVFMDLNGNAIKDDNEPSTTSDSEGYFSISTANVADTSNAKLVVIGGTDTATNMVMDNLVLMSDMPTDLTQTVSVTPISSIIASVDTAEEKAAVLSALSIDKSLDEFLQMDPWALALQGDVEGQRIQQMSQKVAVMITSVQSMAAVDADLVAVSKDVFAAIAKEADDQEMVDFSSQSMLSDVIEEVLPAVDSALVTAAATSLVEANQLIESEADITSSAASDVVEKIQTDYQDLLTELVHSDSVSVDLGESFEDTDNDGIVNLIDTDDDGDSVPDDQDYYPLDSTQSASPSVDNGSGSATNPAEFSEAFGGAIIGEGSLFTFPSSGAEPWAGFANMNTSLYPISISEGGTLTFNASVPAGGSAEVYFRFERLPYPDTEPSFNTANVTVTGSDTASYSVDLPAQGSNTYSSLIMYVVDQDIGVVVTDVTLSVVAGSGSTDSGSDDSGSGDLEPVVNPPAEFTEAFGGNTIANSGTLFNFPSSAESWGGFANMNMALYPLSFTDGGSVSFTGAVPSGGTATIMFRFEYNPYPDVDPAYNTSTVIVSGSEETTYTVDVPSQGANTFRNLIFYITERDVPVEISNVIVTSTGGGDSQGSSIAPPEDYNVIAYGAGSIGDTIYTSNHRCKSDYGYWVENAGVISTDHETQKLGCNQSAGTPTGVITKLYPQLTGPAAEKPTQTHKWWGSTTFLGEMTVGDANDSAYITPDPISARITNMGVRVGSIPSGLQLTNGGQYYYPIPAHEAEVFDGIAVGNSAYANLEAFTKDYSEGSVTVMWKSGSTEVMEATFVHGSPYVYIKAFQGNLEVRTLRQDGVNEKGTFPTPSNMLGIWTSVAGKTNNFLIVGEGSTSFPDLSDSNDPMTTGTYGVINSAKEMTLVYLPQLTAGSVSSSMMDYFASKARNKVAAVNIDYSVNRTNNEITVNHSYVDEQGEAVDTLVGMHPLHWKNASQTPSSSYQIRSARGTIKFAELSAFSYQIPYVGVLPTMPTIDGSFDQATLEGLVSDFISRGSSTWNSSSQGTLFEDTYWSGKNYGKAAELAAIARSIGMQDEADQLINWLKAELSDWFTAEADGQLKAKKYFVYDSDWNTLLGFDEAYGSHQRLADHHFHYGYFVRAAAEICRVDLAWCGQDQYGPMIELLIRDYAADKDDPLFPHMRNFDPANGFSWADGQMNFIRGNNNESTSEAATAYGAIILYGLATGNTELTEKGMYLHASTGATFWEYWNNIDGYNNVSAEADNFFPGYQHITTSIIWGDGVDFATWFSGAYAHILGIQGLPSSPLIFHVGIHSEYMEDYVALGLSESSNGKPSGLVDDMWRDLWWNLWSMTNADAAIADYNTVSSYEPEQGESKAHTYHWINTFKALGHLAMGTGELTSDHPAAIAFDKDGQRTYVVYNFTDQATTVTYSDGHTVNASPLGFTID